MFSIGLEGFYVFPYWFCLSSGSSSGSSSGLSSSLGSSLGLGSCSGLGLRFREVQEMLIFDPYCICMVFFSEGMLLSDWSRALSSHDHNFTKKLRSYSIVSCV